MKNGAAGEATRPMDLCCGWAAFFEMCQDLKLQKSFGRALLFLYIYIVFIYLYIYIYFSLS